MLKEVTQCIPTVGVLYFELFNPFNCSPLPFNLPSPHLSIAFNTHSYILYLYLLWYVILLTPHHSFSFSLSLSFID
jgi:hypothetical protein